MVIVLDDYILKAPVNEKRLAQILNLMRKTNAAYTEIALDPSINDGPPVEGIDNVHIRDRFGPYRTSLQACIWEVNVLKWLLRPGESIWDFERLGSIRSSGVTKPFYLVAKDPVFTYLNAANLGHYLKSVVNYINEQGIKFNPTKLPIDENR